MVVGFRTRSMVSYEGHVIGFGFGAKPCPLTKRLAETLLVHTVALTNVISLGPDNIDHNRPMDPILAMTSDQHSVSRDKLPSIKRTLIVFLSGPQY